jgi:hypothetical protein
MIEQLLSELTNLWVLGFMTYPYAVALPISIVLNLGFGYKYLSFKESYDFMCKNYTKNQEAYMNVCYENEKLTKEIKKLKSSVKVKK